MTSPISLERLNASTLTHIQESSFIFSSLLFSGLEASRSFLIQQLSVIGISAFINQIIRFLGIPLTTALSFSSLSRLFIKEPKSKPFKEPTTTVPWHDPQVFRTNWTVHAENHDKAWSWFHHRSRRKRLFKQSRSLILACHSKDF